jgi:hypothetical protein
MIKRILAIAAILGCTSIAWFILGGTIVSRTQASGVRLNSGVVSTWGAPQEQRPPVAREKSGSVLPAASSRVNVALNLEHRQKGLLWYSTYVVDFVGSYQFQNNAAEAQPITWTLPFPAGQAIYDVVRMEVNGQRLPFTSGNQGTTATSMVGPGEVVTLLCAYRSHGLDSWRYRFGEGVSQARDFLLTVNTNLAAVDFPVDTLSPTSKRQTKSGWALTWRYENLIAGYQIGVAMPEKLQPGPLAGDISFFAPVSLLMFFFLMFIITTIREIRLHPMNYFFLAAAFFSFHLLFAYLVDHISIHLAFVICSAVSISLVVSYLRLVTGLRFALAEAGTAQFVYLVLFSYAFFLKGFAGLAGTIGCIVTLFLVMQLTGRINWSEKFAA